MNTRKTIGQLLIDFGKINVSDLAEGLKLQKKFGLRLGETLIKLGKVTKADIEWTISKQLDIPHVVVEQINLDPVLISKFPKALLLKNKILPMYETDDYIAIAIDDPLNKEALETFERISGKTLKVAASNGEKLEQTLKQFFNKEGVTNILSEIEEIVDNLRGTSFYRIDFCFDANCCRINAFGHGVIKKLTVLNSPLKKEEINNAFDFLNIPFLYDELINNSCAFLSVYPLINKIHDLTFPAVLGVFGLLLPDNITFTDINVQGTPTIMKSDTPIEGYAYISIKNRINTYKKSVFTVDSFPEDLDNIHVNMALPQTCRACNGEGCEKCNNLGYEDFDIIEGEFSYKNLKSKLTKG